MIIEQLVSFLLVALAAMAGFTVVGLLGVLFIIILGNILE